MDSLSCPLSLQKNHPVNVKATRNTWAKRCDGFLAFSTAEDPTVPSINIGTCAEFVLFVWLI